MLARCEHEWMVTTRLLEHRRGELGDVIRTQQPPRVGRCERKVQERLMSFALDQFFSRSAGPDRLSDASQRFVRGLYVPIHERLPCGDDASWVAADIKHVGEVNDVRTRAELIAEPRDLLGGNDHEDRLTRFDPFDDE